MKYLHLFKSISTRKNMKMKNDNCWERTSLSVDVYDVFAHLSSMSSNFDCNDENRILGKRNQEFTDAFI